MGVTTIASLRGIIRDYWRDAGIPKDSYTDSSPIYTMIEKAADKRWNGGNTDGGADPILSFGLRQGLPAAGSATFSTAAGNPGNSTNVRFLVTPAEFWTTMSLSWRALEFGSGDRAYVKAKLLESEGHIKRWTNCMSSYFWGNGGGALAKQSGAGATINGTPTITFTNKYSVQRFEVGDRVQFSATDGTSGTVKSPVFVVLSKNPSAGTLTFTTNIVTGDAILDSDYVFLAGTFGVVPSGFFAWCPKTASAASTTLFGVNRGSDTLALAGNRMKRSKGKDAWNGVLEIMSNAEQYSQDFDVIVTGTDRYRQLLESARPKSLENMAGAGNGRMYGSPVKDNPKKLMYGVDGLCVRWPAANKDVYIYADRYLIDIESDAKSDDLMVATKMDNWSLATGMTGVSWKAYDDNGGPAYQVVGAQQVDSYYGAMGQILCDSPKNNTVYGSSVVE